MMSTLTVQSLSPRQRTVERLELPSISFGTRRSLVVYHYGQSLSETTKRAYIQGNRAHTTFQYSYPLPAVSFQIYAHRSVISPYLSPISLYTASLHADELPGMLVLNHLIKMLDRADNAGQILGRLDIVPFANPIGLSQHFMGTHIGRFSMESGINFNRDYPEVVSGVAKRVDGQLSTTDSDANVRLIRAAMHAEIAASKAVQEEVVMKKLLYSMAVGADVVLDLHCDSHAVMHMYAHDRLWPSVADLAAELESECHLLAPAAGGNPFDEACSCPWADLADKFPAYPIPMACEGQSVSHTTLGQSDITPSSLSLLLL